MGSNPSAATFNTRPGGVSNNPWRVSIIIAAFVMSLIALGLASLTFLLILGAVGSIEALKKRMP